ncbi:MAG: DNA methyltransferase, partial [Candidatus Kapaibacterium sp.]
NWNLSFAEYKESERTKHVHRIHPYKGKFIPQLVEYFIDSHTDKYKNDVFFHSQDIILDPFCGSGTTLVQANELGINAIGIDISAFNALISNIKIKKHDIGTLKTVIDKITNNLKLFQSDKSNLLFEEELLNELSHFNNQYFPSPEFKKKIRAGEVDEMKYSKEKEKEFELVYNCLINKYKIPSNAGSSTNFLDKWFTATVRKEIDFIFNEIKKVSNSDIKKILAIVLSRTIRSCRATTHADLATLKEPVLKTYYCKKHSKICKPIFSILNWWLRYTKDTLKRFQEFDRLRTDTFQICLTGDSRSINIIEKIYGINKEFGDLLKDKKVKGIFSSPPYVGLIDYHEQHAYSYELFGFERQDELEIGPLSKGQGKKARENYTIGIADTLINCKKFLKSDYDIFLVANDKYNLYPKIAELSNMKIINKYLRPVLNRVEKDRSNTYSEIIFHLKEK